MQVGAMSGVSGAGRDAKQDSRRPNRPTMRIRRASIPDPSAGFHYWPREATVSPPPRPVGASAPSGRHACPAAMAPTPGSPVQSMKGLTKPHLGPGCTLDTGRLFGVSHSWGSSRFRFGNSHCQCTSW